MFNQRGIQASDMVAYYNEFEPYAAEWLENLIAAGHIAPGHVDRRSIIDVKLSDLAGYTQCHFFAGLGGWSYALRLAGWPDNRPVWTGSCPCQPFSTAGKGKKQSDERHVWPYWSRLIRECSPSIIFGEQVASAITAGWFDDVCHDMEAQNYAIAAAVLPACSVNAPHKRDRLWFVAQSTLGNDRGNTGEFRKEDGRQEQHMFSESCGAGPVSSILANPQHAESARFGRNSREILPEQETVRFSGGGESISYANSSRGQERGEVGRSGGNLYRPNGETAPQDEVRSISIDGIGENGGNGIMANSSCERLSLRNESGNSGETGAGKQSGCKSHRNYAASYRDFWEIEPSVGRVADGVPARVGRLRAYGNAIVPQVAAEFIKAAM